MCISCGSIYEAFASHLKWLPKFWIIIIIIIINYRIINDFHDKTRDNVNTNDHVIYHNHNLPYSIGALMMFTIKQVTILTINDCVIYEELFKNIRNL